VTTVTRPEDAVSWYPVCVKVAQKLVAEAELEAERSNGLFNMPAGAEFDDLVQAGMEKVLDLRGRDMYPTNALIKQAIKRHIRDVFHLRARKDV
jgi:hypothetical protein